MSPSTTTSHDHPVDADSVARAKARLLSADEANRLNETCRIYVNLMAANTRRRLQTLTGNAFAGAPQGMRGSYA